MVSLLPYVRRGLEGSHGSTMYKVSSAQHHMVLTHLQLLDSFSSFADDQTHFGCRDEKFLDCAVAIYVIVKAGSIPTAVHNLPQEPFGLSLGRRKITRDPALNGCLRSSGKGNGAGENAKESRQPSIQLQLLPHNLGGLNHSPCYRTVIQKQHTPHHITTVSRWSLKEQATDRSHPLHVCPLLLLASQCHASYFEYQQLWWQQSPLYFFAHLSCSLIQHNPHRKPLSTLVNEGGGREGAMRKTEESKG